MWFRSNKTTRLTVNNYLLTLRFFTTCAISLSTKESEPSASSVGFSENLSIITAKVSFYNFQLMSSAMHFHILSSSLVSSLANPGLSIIP